VQIPDAYTLILGQGAGARPADFNFSPQDSGEYLFAKIEPTNSTFPYPLVAPSTAALYLGVHLGISPQECVAPLDFPRYKSKGTVLIDGITFRWSDGPPDLTGRTRALVPSGASYYRDYAGFANSVCYKFHLRTRPIPKQDPVSELETLLSSIKIFPRTAPPVAPCELETPFPLPNEVRDILKLSRWTISYPRIGLNAFHRPQPGISGDDYQPPLPLRPAPLPSNVVFNAITLTYASDLADGSAATAAIAQLQQNVAHILQEYQWTASRETSAPGASRIYRRGDAFAELSVGTSRCTMNSPCTQYDNLTLAIYLPAKLN